MGNRNRLLLERPGGGKRIIAPDDSQIAPADNSQPDGFFRLTGGMPPKRSTTRTSRGPVVPVLALGERSGELCNSFPMLWVRNVQEIAGEVQEHPLAGGRYEAARGV